MDTENKLDKNEFYGLVKYFSEHDFSRDETPIPYSTFKEYGWDEPTFIEYLNVIDALRSAIVLLNLKYELNWSKYRRCIEEPNEIIGLSFTYFSEFCQEKMSVSITEDQFKAILSPGDMPLRKSYMEKWFKVLDPKKPSYEATEIDPQVFINYSLDRFRLIIEGVISRAAKGDELIKINEYDGNLEKLKYSSYEAMCERLDELKMKKYSECYDNKKECDKTNFDSMNSIWKTADKRSDYWFEQDEIDDSISKLEDLIEEWKENPWFSSKSSTLYVHRGMVKCLRDKHKIRSITANIPGPSGRACALNVNYCVECDKFFITEKSFEYYRKRYGLLAAHFVFESENGSASPYRELAEQSPLKLCGYSVSATEGYSTKERQGLLAAIMDNSIMTKTDILTYLQWFLQFNGSKFGNESAVMKWQEDLSFVRDYHIGEQAHCYISEVKQWGK